MPTLADPAAATTGPAGFEPGFEPGFEVARRLAEEFDAVPLPTVGRAVRAAVRAVAAQGELGRRSLPAIERLARAELTAVSARTA